MINDRRLRRALFVPFFLNLCKRVSQALWEEFLFQSPVEETFAFLPVNIELVVAKLLGSTQQVRLCHMDGNVLAQNISPSFEEFPTQPFLATQGVVSHATCFDVLKILVAQRQQVQTRCRSF